MKRSIRSRIFLTICMVLMFISQLIEVSAVEADRMPELEAGKSGALTVTLSCENEQGTTVYIQGVTIRVIKVADLIVDRNFAEYHLAENFEQSGVVLADMTASESNKAAKILKAIALEKELIGQEAVTDGNGKASFAGLEHGMYLVMQTANADTVPEYTEMDPYLVSVPFPETTGERSQWDYEVDAMPKTQIGQKTIFGSIVVTKKVSVYDGETYTPGNGINTVFYVGLFKDAEGTKLYSDESIFEIKLNNTSAGSVEFTNLPEGIYYVYETTAEGTPIKNGETLEDDLFTYTCMVEGNGENRILLDPALEDKTEEIIINNVITDIPEGYFRDTEIEIKKSVFLGNDRVKVQDTFYAGIFTKENEKYLLNQVIELKQNDEVTVTIMLTEENIAEYWVFETDSEGNPIDKEWFSYEVSGEGVVKLSADDPKETVEIVNRIKEIPEETEETEIVTEIETETEETTTPPETEKNVTKTVETGDETQGELYILLMMAAFLTLGYLVKVRYNKIK